MRQLSAMSLLLVIVLVPMSLFAQSSPPVSASSVPRVINITGVFRSADGQPAGAVETVTLSIYADQEGGTPLWQETQTIAVDRQGRYSLLLGATQADGIPAAVFGTGDAQWLGTVFERAGEVEGRRIRITSVPYALRAADADTLGGRPAADYLLAAASRDSVSAGAASVDATPDAIANVVLAGTDNVLAKYMNGGVDVGNSAVYEANGSVGINTTAPFDTLHVRFNNPSGSITGYAVQNLGNTATSVLGHPLLRPVRGARAVPRLQQRHARIPHQQHRPGVARRRLQRLHQLHDRRHPALKDRYGRWHDNFRTGRHPRRGSEHRPVS